MSQAQIFYPVFALVALTVTVWLIMGRTRMRAVRERRVPFRYFGVYQGDDLPEDVAKTSRNFKNLLEVPILFYAVTLFMMQLGQVDAVFVIMAWVYVALRVLHSWIHLTYNRIQHRFNVYVVSCLVLFAIWVRLLVQVLGQSV